MALNEKKKSNALIYIMLFVLLGVTILALFSGRYSINFNTIRTSEGFNIFYNVGMPRVIMSLMCGGALGVSGGIFQKVFKNDLASPDIIGISSGSSLGAVIAIVLFGSISYYIQLFAFLGGILSVVFVFIIANFNKENYIFSLIISGIVISALCTSVVMIFKYTADPYNKLPSIEFWLMGGLHNVKVQQMYFVLILYLILFFIIYKLRWSLQVISLSDDEIKSLGVNIFARRVIFIIIATFLVSTVVPNCGVIGWVGLIAPYIARLITKKWIFMSFIIGSIILVISDTLARSITANEIPIGILISFLGAPFLIYLLVKRGSGYNA